MKYPINPCIDCKEKNCDFSHCDLYVDWSYDLEKWLSDEGEDDDEV